MNLQEIKLDAGRAVSEMIERGNLKKGDIFVVGCSSSEMAGGVIGKNSAYEAALAAFEGIYPVLCGRGVYLAAQCCEHLNRALIVERECAERYDYAPVWVRPQPKAGGSFATAAYENMKSPVAVEHIKAHAGIDIGGTLIGMHLREVAVPARLAVTKIGEANLLAAFTRPKYIGGPRAVYE